MKFDGPQFESETAARKYIEALRWPSGRVCPKCGVIGLEYETKREGRYRCGARDTCGVQGVAHCPCRNRCIFLGFQFRYHHKS